MNRSQLLSIVTVVLFFGFSIPAEAATDSDRDGIPDAKELRAVRPFRDLDGDGASNRRESRQGTSITNRDTDGDGLEDGIDPSPRNSDSNNDGIVDGNNDDDNDGIANEDEDDGQQNQSCIDENNREDGDDGNMDDGTR